MKLTKVFEPGKIGNLELKNRLVVSAMSSHMGNPDGTPNEAVNAYLVAKVKGGWGLVFTEDLGVTRTQAVTPSSAPSGAMTRFPHGPRPSVRYTPQADSWARRYTMPAVREA